MKKIALAFLLLFPLAATAQPSRFSLATQVRPGFGTIATEGTVNLLGDTYYAVDSTTFGRVAGNTSATTKYYCQTGTGTVSAAPSWCVAPGTVTSVGNGTIGALFSVSWATATSTPALSLNLAAQSANCVIAGPASAGPSVPTCRSLVTADFPASGVTATTYGDASHVAQVTVDATGRVTSASSVAIAAGTGITSINADNTAAQVIAAGTGIGVATAGGTTTITYTGGGGAATQWIRADPNFSVGTSYERPTYPLAEASVQLAPQRTWTETIADAIANVPGGWTLGNSAKLAAADENTTTSSGLFLSGSTGSTYDWTSASQAAPYYYTTLALGAGADTYIARLQIPSSVTSTSVGLGLLLFQQGTLGNVARIGMTGGTASTCIIFWSLRSTSGSTTTACTNVNNGIWFKIERYGNSALNSYSLTNSSTPPSTGWTYPQALGAVFTDAASAEAAGFFLSRTGAVSPAQGSVLYFDDTWGRFPLRQPEGLGAAQAAFATGFDNSSPVLTLVSGYNLGSSSATVADADVQAALTEITNQRAIDTATWTWSVSRGSSAPVACGGGTYAAAASVTVGGTGQYISVCGKAASSGRVQPGSVNAAALRIPFAP